MAGGAGSELTLGTWNILHGLRVRPGVDGDAPPGEPDARALAASAAELDADVLGLQEVDRHQPRSGAADQTAAVAAAMGATAARFVPALYGTPGAAVAWRPADGGEPGVDVLADDAQRGGGAAEPAYGVGLVSRLPVRSWHVRRFPAARGSLPLYVPGQGLVRVPDEPRAAVAAVVDLPGGRRVTVATCHLSFVPVVNARQLRAVCAWLRELPGPRVLVGDLNLPGPLPAWASRWVQLARAATYPSWRPRVQWDHALADGLGREHVRSAEAVTLAVSDHRALRLRLDLAATAAPVPDGPAR